MSVVVTHALDNLGKGDVLAHVSNLDSDALALFGVGNDNDETALYPSDTVSLVAYILDFNRALFALFDRWLRWATFALWVSVSVVGFVVGR